MKNKILAAIVSVAFICLISVSISYAATAGIGIDGDFSDWEGSSSVDLSGSSSYFSSANLVYDDTYIYLHVVEQPSNIWDTRYPNITFNVDGTSKNIVIARNDYSNVGASSISVKNSWSGNINNASGMTYRYDDHFEWEIKLPINAVFSDNGNDGGVEASPIDVSSINASWSAGGQVSLIAEDFGNNVTPPSSEDTTEASTDSSSDASTEIGTTESEGSGSGGAIVINGYYDDWEGIPKTLITYGSNQDSENIREYHQGAIVVSEGKVYIYVKMSDYYNAQIPLTELYLSIGGISKAFQIRGVNSDGSINWGTNVYNLSEGIHNEFGIFYRDGGNKTLGDVAVTIAGAGSGDTFEYSMSISELEKLYGLEKGTIENGAMLEFYSPNIGADRVTTVGTSTAPYIGIALCIIAVGGALIYRNRKKKVSL